MTERRSRRGWAITLAAALAALTIACLAAVWAPARENAPPARALYEPTVRVELRSWIVAGRGRHLYAVVIPPEDAPPELAVLADVVEYWSTAQRFGYRAPGDQQRDARIAKMPRGVRVRPMLTNPEDRLEAVFHMTQHEAEALVRDRMFASRYFLLGPNSTSGLRAAFRAAGFDFPAHILDGRGVLGEFPGVDLQAGAEIPADQWIDFGVASGPEPFPPPAMTPKDPGEPGAILRAAQPAAVSPVTPGRRRGRRAAPGRTPPPPPESATRRGLDRSPRGTASIRSR